jgi:hypothetical protein
MKKLKAYIIYKKDVFLTIAYARYYSLILELEYFKLSISGIENDSDIITIAENINDYMCYKYRERLKTF